MSEPITATEFEDRLRAAAGGCRMLSEGDKCDCGLCRRDEEIERLRAEVERLREENGENMELRRATIRRLQDDIMVMSEEIVNLRATIKAMFSERDGRRGYVETATRLRTEVERLNDVVARLNRVAEEHVASLKTEVERLKAALAHREAEGGG